VFQIYQAITAPAANLSMFLDQKNVLGSEKADWSTIRLLIKVTWVILSSKVNWTLLKAWKRFQEPVCHTLRRRGVGVNLCITIVTEQNFKNP
jgi:hypothetical protein